MTTDRSVGIVWNLLQAQEMPMHAHRSALSLLAAALLLSSSSAWAENLIDAYQQAYHTDPVLAQA
ncbi:hypothetical protein, partial [Acidithiobacillus thiooxidans]|uniref:hypothetical protein n=1 Tax=Acidithiobacillus thiooxidans TaxID=930 RepID=UPI001C0676F1